MDAKTVWRGHDRMANGRIELLTEMMALRQHDASSGWFVPASQALLGLTAPQAAWVPPGEGTHTIWQLVSHLTFWTRVVTQHLDGVPVHQRDNEATFGPPGDPEDAAGWSAALEALSQAYDGLRAAVGRQRDADLDRRLGDRRGTPAGRMVGGILSHDAYHIGQIVLLRKLQGSWSPEA